VSSIVTEPLDDITVLRIDRPPVNALDIETLNELADRLEDAAAAEAVAGIVLTGTGPIMSAGADLVKVLQAEQAELDAGIDALTRAFRTLFEFPKPAVAAVNGHALAGGAVLTCGCDHRVMGETAGRIGAVELRAGVPFPAWALELVRHAVNNEHLQEVVYFGRAYEPKEALAKGLVDELVPDGELMDTAIARVRSLTRVPTETFAVTKRSLRAAAGAAASALERFDDDVKATWSSDEVKAAIARQLDAMSRSSNE
jgi:enoyl-CoA hydratase